MTVIQEAPTDGDTPATTHRVLVAEDDSLIRMDLIEMLREEGYDVVGEAPNGQVAVELTESLKPDLVIMDIKMPVRDGIDAASEIAAKRLAPVVMLTALSRERLPTKRRDERTRGTLSPRGVETRARQRPSRGCRVRARPLQRCA